MSITDITGSKVRMVFTYKVCSNSSNYGVPSHEVGSPKYILYNKSSIDKYPPLQRKS